jgi:hypothetical protein
MLGDPFGFCARRTITVPGFQTITTVTTTTVTTTVPPVTTTVTVTTPFRPLATVTTTSTHTEAILRQIERQVDVCDPLALRGIYKISFNESPAPQDRVFFNYLYGYNLQGTGGSALPSFVTTTTTATPAPGTTVTTVQTTDTPGALVGARRLNTNYEIAGFEKTILGGFASIGMRLPMFQQSGDGSLGKNDFGDLSVIFKGLLWSDAQSGNLISGGVMVTAPTGPDIPTTLGNVHSTLIQPFVGHLWLLGDLCVQGFSSVCVPTESRDVTLLYNSLGVNYLLYRAPEAGILTWVSPLFEVYVTTPLNHRNNHEELGVPDLVSLACGAHFGLGERALLTLGMTTPVTGPRPYDFTAQAYFNYRF